MLLFKKVDHLKSFLSKERKNGKSIGFSPTMGALHQGHVSLVKRSIEETDISICSIFVNPTQFDDKKDLQKYPRTTGEDIDLLESIGTDIVFLPDVEEIYPNGQDAPHGFDFGAMANHMEGAHRDGHFDGMAQVVKRLLEIVEPDFIYMGQKDYQQQALVKVMLQQMDTNCELVRCDIIREPDGLAMSSRNVRLNEEDRKTAGKISETLRLAKEEAKSHSLQSVKENALKRLDIPQFTVDYFEIINAFTLQPISEFEEAESVVACTTVRIGGIRLLDNMILK